jgi:hypothetical protein
MIPEPSCLHRDQGADPSYWTGRLALLWQIFSMTGFPNQFFDDSWVVGFWRADHEERIIGFGS